MNRIRGYLAGALAAGLLIFAGCGTQTGSVVVQGKLVDVCGQPMAYKAVAVSGHDPVLTAEDGTFTVDGVQVPYDVAIGNAYIMAMDYQELPILVYKGLTSLEPVLVAKDANARWDESCAHATVNATLIPADPETPLDDSYRNGMGLMLPPYYDADDFAYDAAGNVTLAFNPDLDPTATLLGVQWQRDATTYDATAFLGAKVETVTLADGETQDVEMQLEPIDSRTLTVNVEYPDLYNLGDVMHRVTYEGSGLAIETARISSRDANEDGTFTVIGPVGAGLGSQVLVDGAYGNELVLDGVDTEDLVGVFGWGGVWVNAPEGSDVVTARLPEPLVPVAPLQGAVITADTTFSWSGAAGTVYHAIFDVNQSGPDLTIEVVTTDTALSLPDLSGLGISYDNAWDLRWSMFGLGGDAFATNMDDLATEEGIAPYMTLGGLEFVSLPGTQGYFYYVEAGDYDIGYVLK